MELGVLNDDDGQLRSEAVRLTEELNPRFILYSLQRSTVQLGRSFPLSFGTGVLDPFLWRLRSPRVKRTLTIMRVSLRSA